MEDRANILRELKICRFCLDENGPFSNIYEKDGQQVVPLPLQIMACVAIEVFANDGMPQLICRGCRYQTQQAYNFKQLCKRSDDALKLFLATGNLMKPTAVRSNQEKETPSKKRALPTIQNEPAKKSKQDVPLVTLNYSSALETKDDQNVQQVSKDGSAGEEILGFDDAEKHRASETVYEKQRERDVEQEEDEDREQNVNPLLKVPQVKTDVYPCPHCERSFPLQQLLELHVKNHERERNFSCEECGRKFFTKYDLSKHVQTHTDIKPYTCVVCTKQFSRESLLHRHEKIHIAAPKYLCTECDRTFLTREALDAHTEKHKKRRPFSCRLCNKSFVFKQGLERHELSHSDQKPHKCNYCEASFTSPIKLTRHITSHAGLRPYPCKLCGRTFLLSHHLTRHMRSHYAAKSPNAQPIGQHKCDVCSMSFRRKDSLINHSAIHSMVNLKCVICNTEFESAKMVKEHITTHLAGLPYPCDKCDYSFETQDQLEEHELKHAEMEYEEQIEKEISQEAMQHQEAHQQRDQMEDYDDEDYSAEEDIAEFSITNPENPEVVRRSKREPKIKNFADFLKDELGSDLEDEIQQDQGREEEDDDDDLLYKPPSSETIKPVVRTEGTKVYTRKNASEKEKIKPVLPQQQQQHQQPSSLENISQLQLPALDNFGLAKEAVNAFPPNKNYIDMKIGNKLVRVQKVIMSKAEIQAMAKEGKIEMKGNTILLKNSQVKVPALSKASLIGGKQNLQNISIDSIFQEASSGKDQENRNSQVQDLIMGPMREENLIEQQEETVGM